MHQQKFCDLEEAISNLQVSMVDSVKEIKHLKRIEDIWKCNLGTLFVGLNTRNEVLSNNRVNYDYNCGVSRLFVISFWSVTMYFYMLVLWFDITLLLLFLKKVHSNQKFEI